MEKYIEKHTEGTELNISTLKEFTKVSYKITKLENELIQQGGVTITQYDVLTVLYRNGRLKVGQIIEKTLTTQGNITVVIKNLEKQGLVKRYQNLEDKRAIDIDITNKGSQIVETIRPKHIEIINNLFKNFSDEEKRVLNTILKKFNYI